MKIGQQADRLLTRKEVAEIFQISTMTVSRWSIEGIIKSYKAGVRTVRFKESEIYDALKKQNNG